MRGRMKELVGSGANDAHRGRGRGIAAAALLASLALYRPPAHAEDAGAMRASLSLEASLSERTLRVHDGDRTLSYPIAIGDPKWPTPTGRFRIRKIVWNPAWVPPDQPWARDKKPEAPGARKNPMKLVKMFFREPAYYIHGTNAVGSLGSAASHGCIRMDPDDAYRVARYLMAHGGQPRDENWFRRLLHFRSETKTVYLDSPVPLTITR